MSDQSETPRCDALHRNPLDSNDLRAWRNLARDLERQISILQTEIKGHMRIEDDLKRDLGLERESHEVTKRMLSDRDDRIAELEKALAWCADHSGECLGDHMQRLNLIRALLKDRA